MLLAKEMRARSQLARAILAAGFFPAIALNAPAIAQDDAPARFDGQEDGSVMAINPASSRTEKSAPHRDDCELVRSKMHGLLSEEQQQKVRLRDSQRFGDGVYEGQTLGRQPCGLGRYYFNNGAIYSGFWAGKIVFGTKAYSDGRIEKGDFDDGGRLLSTEKEAAFIGYANGDVYLGSVVNGKAEGEGELLRATVIIKRASIKMAN